MCVHVCITLVISLFLDLWRVNRAHSRHGVLSLLNTPRCIFPQTGSLSYTTVNDLPHQEINIGTTLPSSPRSPCTFPPPSQQCPFSFLIQKAIGEYILHLVVMYFETPLVWSNSKSFLSLTILKSTGLTFYRMAYKFGSLMEGIPKNDALPFLCESHQTPPNISDVNLDNLIIER